MLVQDWRRRVGLFLSLIYSADISRNKIVFWRGMKTITKNLEEGWTKLASSRKGNIYLCVPPLKQFKSIGISCLKDMKKLIHTLKGSNWWKYMKNQFTINYRSLQLHLKNERQILTCIIKTDTHWNRKGAF